MATPRLHVPRNHPLDTTIRILIIEDDMSVGSAIQAVLTQCRYETTLASRAHAGIHRFQMSKFHLVMVDLFLPGMNGLDTITQIRNVSAVPIIAMSGFRLRNLLDPEQDFLSMAMFRGATSALRKPFSPPQLLAAVERSVGLTSYTEEQLR